MVKPAAGPARDTRRHPRARRCCRYRADARTARRSPQRAAAAVPAERDRDGETALIYLDGLFSHAPSAKVRSCPPVPATAALFAAEEITPVRRVPTNGRSRNAFLACAAVWHALCARIDLIRGGAAGEPRLLELGDHRTVAVPRARVRFSLAECLAAAIRCNASRQAEHAVSGSLDRIALREFELSQQGNVAQVGVQGFEVVVALDREQPRFIGGQGSSSVAKARSISPRVHRRRRVPTALHYAPDRSTPHPHRPGGRARGRRAPAPAGGWTRGFLPQCRQSCVRLPASEQHVGELRNCPGPPETDPTCAVPRLPPRGVCRGGNRCSRRAAGN